MVWWWSPWPAWCYRCAGVTVMGEGVIHLGIGQLLGRMHQGGCGNFELKPFKLQCPTAPLSIYLDFVECVCTWISQPMHRVSLSRKQKHNKKNKNKKTIIGIIGHLLGCCVMLCCVFRFLCDVSFTVCERRLLLFLILATQSHISLLQRKVGMTHWCQIVC